MSLRGWAGVRGRRGGRRPGDERGGDCRGRRRAARRWAWNESLTTLRASATSVPVSVVLALTAINAIWANRFAGLLFVGLGFLALAGQRASTEWRRRYANLERLYRFAQRTSGVSEVDDVVWSILSEARQVMGSGVAELVLPDADGCLCYHLDASDRLVCTVRPEPGRSGADGAGQRMPGWWRPTTTLGRRWRRPWPSGASTTPWPPPSVSVTTSAA